MINEKSEHIYSQSMRPEMYDFLPSEYSKVLEVGCNVGNFSQLLNKPYEYWGVEPLKEAAEIAKTKMDKVLVLDRYLCGEKGPILGVVLNVG